MAGRRRRLATLWRHAHLALTVLVLLVWSLSGRDLAGVLFLPIWVLATQLIVAGSLEAARLRRRAWLDQYLRDDSPWHGWLRGGAMMVVRHQLLGALLALVLLVKLRLLAPPLWPVVLAGVPGLVVAQDLLRRRLARHVITEHLPAVTRRLVVVPTAGLLALILVVATLWLPQPWLVGLGWEEAILRHFPGDTGGAVLGFFERLVAIAEISQHWTMQNAEERFGLAMPLAMLGWSLLLLTQSTFAWAYVRLLVGAEALRRGGRRHQHEALHVHHEEGPK
ncbi:hypothetical protein [Halomonas rhizosphaerae]|uniref:Uncharacterized protein n=1 Tax=Halomonas rhizosphaerae TaxID=3043296 RepID=A0ABT6V4U2_9GAMM|nr:hypothetical protein [Halomonas rhizosphaerae]MDI5893258.1 hypothetical protein [Halomonas rhizosphaerae]